MQIATVESRLGKQTYAIPYKAATLIKIRHEPAEQFRASSNAAVILLGEIEQPIHGRSGPRRVAHAHTFQHRLMH